MRVPLPLGFLGLSQIADLVGSSDRSVFARLPGRGVDADRARLRSGLEWKTAEVRARAAGYGEAGAGRPVLFLHGWGLDHKTYKAALRHLVVAGYRVLAPAMPGFGGTPALGDQACTIDGYAAWVADFLAAVGVEQPVLVIGHSFGGGVAIELAYRHPELVDGLVLCNSIGSSTGSRTSLTTMAQRPLWDWGIHLPGDVLSSRQAWRVLPVIVSELGTNLLRDPRAFWQVAGIARRADLTNSLEALKRRHLPVAVLWGKRDQIVTRESFEQMCRVLGDPKVVTVEGSHSWLIADPDAFGEVITNVLGDAFGEVITNVLGDAFGEVITNVLGVVTVSGAPVGTLDHLAAAKRPASPHLQAAS